MASINCSRGVTDAHKKNKRDKCIYFYQRGGCLKGSDCPWRHETVCPNIGNCSNSDCEFSHQLPQCTHHNAPACAPAPALASASQQNLRAIAQAFVPNPAPAPQAYFLSQEEVEKAYEQEEQEEQEEQKLLEDDGSVHAALELRNDTIRGLLKLLNELGVPEERIQQVFADAKEEQAARVYADQEEQELNGTWCGD